MTNNNNVVNVVAIALAALTLTACGGSGSKSEPVVVEPAGLTLDETMAKMNGSSLERTVSGSFGSGADFAVQDLDFAYLADNTARICVDYTNADDSNVKVEDYTFNDYVCSKKVTVGGKSDLDSVIADINSDHVNAFVSKPFASNYDVFYGSEDASFNVISGEILECRDSVTSSSNYITTSSPVANVDLSLAAGVLADEYTGVESVSVDCDVVGADGNTKTFQNVGVFNVGFSSIPNKNLIDRIAEDSENSVVGYDVQGYFVENIGDDSVIESCDGVLENDYGTRACLKIGADGSELSNADIVINEAGVDYKVSGVNYSNYSDVSSDLTSRLGTPVLKQVKNYSYANFWQNNSTMDFEIRNVDVGDSICDYTTEYSEMNDFLPTFSNSTTDETHFNKFELNQIPLDYTHNMDSKFYDESGNYYLGNLNCNFTNLNSGEDVKINNILSISGNIHDDKINFP